MMISAREIIRGLNGHWRGSYGGTARCPAHDDRSPSLSVRDAGGKVLVHCHAGCDQGAVIEALRARGLWPDKGETRPSRQIEPRLNPAPVDDADRIGRARELFHCAWLAAGTPVEAYLRSRGLVLPANDFEVIRFDPRHAFRLTDGATIHLPAMIALFRDTVTNRPVAIHRTALRPDGSGKAVMPDGSNPKRMLGRVKGAAIKFSADDEVTLGLGIAEGIETGLSVLQSFEWAPIWVCGSAPFVAEFPVLAGIECLTIFADHDENGAGMAAAQKCAERWVSAGKEAIIRPPRQPGDWNSVGGRDGN
jgi:putative DNA primase/helicase